MSSQSESLRFNVAFVPVRLSNHRTGQGRVVTVPIGGFTGDNVDIVRGLAVDQMKPLIGKTLRTDVTKEPFVVDRVYSSEGYTWRFDKVNLEDMVKLREQLVLSIGEVT